MDDYMFPAYISPKIPSKSAKFMDSMCNVLCTKEVAQSNFYV